MKLRNKLIPIFSTVALATATAPIAASCGYWSSFVNGTLDITSPYTPTIAKSAKVPKAQAKSEEEVYQLYMSNVMKNPEILQQDIWQYESKRLPQRIYEVEHTSIDENGMPLPYQTEKCSAVSDVTAIITASNISVNKHEATIAAKKIEFYTVDMYLGYDFAFSATSLVNEPKIQFTKNVHFTSEYHNIPLYIYNSGSAWSVSVDIMSDEVQELLNFVPGWYFACDFSNTYNVDVIVNGNVQKYSNTSTFNDTFTRRSQIWALKEQVSRGQSQTILGITDGSYLNFISYYLSDVYCPEQLVKFNPLVSSYTQETKISSTTNDITLNCNSKMFQCSNDAIEKMIVKNYDTVSLEFLNQEATPTKWENNYKFKANIGGDDIYLEIKPENISFSRVEKGLYLVNPKMHSTNGFVADKQYRIAIVPDSHLFRAKFINSKTGDYEYSQETVMDKSFEFLLNTVAA